MNHQSIYIFQRIKHVPKKKKLLEILKCPIVKIMLESSVSMRSFWCINTFFLPASDKGSGVLCRKWQASQNPDVKWYVIKGLKCSQESNGFFSFSDYFFSYMVIVVSLITSVIHLCGCDLVSSLVKQNCLKLESEWRQERCTCPLMMA